MKRKNTRLLLLGLALAWPACGKARATPNAPTPGSSTPPGPVRDQFVAGLVLDGLVFPTTQFRLAGADACDGQHWHMRSNYVVSIGRRRDPQDPEIIGCHGAGEFVSRTDPDPGRCGFGKVSQVLEVAAYVSKECYDRWLAVAPS